MIKALTWGNVVVVLLSFHPVVEYVMFVGVSFLLEFSYSF
jgi:hypothetical protein